MKKHSKIYLLLSFLLVACNSKTISSSSTINNSNSNGQSSNSSISASVDTSKNQLIISECVEGSATYAVELYNFTDQDADLNDYEFYIYGTSTPEPVRIIKLSGTLKAKETFVIVGERSMDELIFEKADLISEQLMFSGSQALAVAYKGVPVDLIGYPGYSVSYAKDLVLVRKMNHTTPHAEYDEYDWIRYEMDEYQYLGTFEASITEEELLEGPKLTEEFINAPFFKEGSNNTVGAGGIAKVRVSSYVDGDTTCFFYPEELGIEQGLKVRYQNINTPESFKGGIEPWGMPAKDYTKTQLSRASEIYVQSVKDGSIYETYDRLLGWVWADGELLNFKIVKAGYSEVQFGEVNTMSYKGVTYTNFLHHAQIYAKRNGLKIHGEQDPTWDYEKWESYYD